MHACGDVMMHVMMSLCCHLGSCDLQSGFDGSTGMHAYVESSTSVTNTHTWVHAGCSTVPGLPNSGRKHASCFVHASKYVSMRCVQVTTCAGVWTKTWPNGYWED